MQDKCPLTGRDVEMKHLTNHIHYSLNIANHEVDVFICDNCRRKIDFNVPSHIVEGLIANRKWPERIELVSEECNLTSKIADGETVVLQEFLRTADYPKTPKEKLDNLVLYLFNLQNYDGEPIRINVRENDFVLKNYFKNVAECAFYLNSLAEQGLIELAKHISDGTIVTLNLTHSGLNKTIELTEEGEKSNKCFIAMSFNPSTKPTREAIRKALNDTGYEAVIIDEQIIDSARTINDEIIASLKKCKFCIADFSFHSNGVYFESGFALGQGKKVIYTCSKEEFENAHFDIRPLQHIIYESPEQLVKDLKYKIEAFIN
jgi:nucleoside 2-deoxyribosyltransferase